MIVATAFRVSVHPSAVVFFSSSFLQLVTGEPESIGALGNIYFSTNRSHCTRKFKMDVDEVVTTSLSCPV